VGSRLRPYIGMTAFIGPMGSGKTYSLVEVAKRKLEQGRRVYTNAGFVVQGCEELRDVEEFAILPPGSVFLLDEAQNVFNARLYASFPPMMTYRASQLRKDDLEFYWSSQHEDSVDVTFRRLTQAFWHCRAITGRAFVRALYPPEQFRKQGERPRRREWRRIRMEVADLYDTKGKVSVPLSWVQNVRDKRRDDPLVQLLPGETLEGLFARLEGEGLLSKPGRRSKVLARVPDVGDADAVPLSRTGSGGNAPGIATSSSERANGVKGGGLREAEYPLTPGDGSGTGQQAG